MLITETVFLGWYMYIVPRASFPQKYGPRWIEAWANLAWSSPDVVYDEFIIIMAVSVLLYAVLYYYEHRTLNSHSDSVVRYYVAYWILRSVA